MQRKNIRDKYMSVEYNINRGGWIEAASHGGNWIRSIFGLSGRVTSNRFAFVWSGLEFR